MPASEYSGTKIASLVFRQYDFGNEWCGNDIQYESGYLPIAFMKDTDNITELLPKPLLLSLWVLAVAITYKLFSQFTADYDIWFHLFIGGENFANASIGCIDVYSFTAFGLPVINHEWLADLIMTGAYKVSGETGLICWRWVMALAIVFCSIKLIKTRPANHLSQIVTYLCFAVVIAQGISFRVQLFSYLFLLLLLYVIYKKPKKVPFSATVVTILFLLWANIHGAFVLGLLIWYIYLGEQFFAKTDKITPYSILLLSIMPVAITIINPYGIKLWLFIYSELSNPISSQYITEWQQFSFDAREMPFLIVLLMTWLAYCFSGKAKRLAETLVLILASIMGLAAVRHTPLFVVLTLPSMAYHFDGVFNRLTAKMRQGPPSPPLATYLAALFLLSVAAVFFFYGVSQQWRIRTDEDPLPSRSVAFLKVNNFKGNLWTPLHWGAYALFHLYPNIKVSIDGRWAMVYPHDVMMANMEFAYHGTGGRWKKLLEKYNTDYALVEKGNPALTEMKYDSDWVLAFGENTCWLLMKKETISSHKAPITIPNKNKRTWP